MIRASATITLSIERDITAHYLYYLLQPSTLNAPGVPKQHPPEASAAGYAWDDTEPGYMEGSTNTLYCVSVTLYSDGTFAYSPVSVSSSYEAAKLAYNEAMAAKAAADAAQVHQGSSPPEYDIPVGKLWLDRSVEPPVLRRWSGLSDAMDKSWTVDMQGNPVLVDDAAIRRFESIVTTFTPRQEEIPYPPMGGKNLCDEAALLLGYYGSNTEVFTSSDAYRSIKQQLPAGTYTISISMDEEPYLLRMYKDGVRTTITTKASSYTFTLDADCEFAFCFRNTSTTASFTNLKVQIERGNTATDYAPYSLESPIIGRRAVTLTHCGRNLLDESILREGYYSSNGNFEAHAAYRSFAVNLPAGSYTLSISMDETPYIVRSVSDGTVEEIYENLAQHTFTLEKPCAYALTFRNTNTSESFTNLRVQLEIGDTATAYEPYGGGPMVAELGDTVYGGSLDWISGELTVNYACEKLGSEIIGFGTTSSGVCWAAVKLAEKTYLGGVGWCNHYPFLMTEFGSFSDHVIDPDIGLDVSIMQFVEEQAVYIYDRRFTDFESAQSILAGMDIYVAYQLATPKIVQLSRWNIVPKTGANSFLSDIYEVYEKDDGIALCYTASGWDTINDVSGLVDALDGMVKRDELQHVIRAEQSGLYVGALDNPCQVWINSSSVNIMFGNVRYASFALDHARFGDYRLGLAEDGGLMFRPE